MLIIVAHHYVVNSGLIDLVRESVNYGINDAFLQLFGWGGKTGINCFVLITGYFMCSSNITTRKFIKLLAEVEFYAVTIYAVFVFTGYEVFSVKELVKTVFPITEIESNFTSCFLVFYLFIPFLNILIHHLSERQHLYLMALCVIVCTILPSIMVRVRMSYVAWFCVLFFIASYIRLYPKTWFESKRLWGWLTLANLLLSWTSVVAISLLGKKFGVENQYFFVADSNKVLALSTAICAFMLFKNLKIKKSRLINTISASTFGVLLIHANSDTMRQWLWKDTLKNMSYYSSGLLPAHAIASVIGVYVICTLIDYARIRWLEKPFLNLYDNHLFAKERG